MNPPIFVLGLMRSGTTMMLRALNCHPDITIWGEHAGALQPLLREAHGVSLDEHSRAQIAAGYKRRDIIVGELADPRGFDAWVSPFTPEELESSVDEFLRTYIESLFSRGLPEHVRWGFKETRYPRSSAERLAQLFPEAHFVVVTRDFVPWASSVVRAPWRDDLDPAALDDAAAVERAMASLTKLWVQRTRAMTRFAADDPAQRFVVALEDFDEVRALAEFVPTARGPIAVHPHHAGGARDPHGVIGQGQRVEQGEAAPARRAAHRRRRVR